MNAKFEKLHRHLDIIARGDIYYDKIARQGDHVSIPMYARHTKCKKFLRDCECK